MSSSVAVKGSGDGGKGKAVASLVGAKKVDGSGKVVSISKQKSVTVASKQGVKEKSSSTSKRTVTKTTTVKVRAEKKVYSLPGQKYDPPEEVREPLRIFYESLSKQIPSSEMAEFWTRWWVLMLPKECSILFLPKRGDFFSPFFFPTMYRGGKIQPELKNQPDLTLFGSGLDQGFLMRVGMMEHGLLSPERAKKAYERKQKRQQQLRMGTPIKSTKQERPESSKKPQVSKNGDVKAKKRVNYNDDDDDFIVKQKKSKGKGKTYLGNTKLERSTIIAITIAVVSPVAALAVDGLELLGVSGENLLAA
ncbi:hypothetical protein COCNU_06G005280 [Cocos nucifera]|uniref:Uncharacterized protein n=1 Tax=Cocos nucifera TaxID=13894 RepID=A0A8K0IAE9_COCNU|nr:hypothetical protein COCNU_06G005280 [Cocos nucifera]